MKLRKLLQKAINAPQQSLLTPARAFGYSLDTTSMFFSAPTTRAGSRMCLI